MKIGILGIGKLGLCFGLNLSKVGHEVYGIDKNEKYIQSLKDKTFDSPEKDVNNYLSKYGFNYSSKIEDALDCETIFIVVQTPSTPDHKYDHSIIEKIKNEIISKGKAKKRVDLVINCTTFPGYCENLHDELNKYNYFVSYNPEFIAQGTIIYDQLYCDNVLIGQADDIAGDKIRNIYKTFVKSDPVYNCMSRTEAEITKLSVNCFLTTKISFANMIADIAYNYNSNPEIILNAVGTDSRIGKKYLKPGFGYGGPCFPRDNRALAKCADEVGIDAVISKATDKMNEKHLEYQIDRVVKNLNKEKDFIEIEYLTYKKESVSFEESQELKFALKLKELGYKLKIKDSRKNIKEILKNEYGIQ